MAADPKGPERMREDLADMRTPEIAMFGGICFPYEGHVVAGVTRSAAVFRVGRAAWAEALARPGTTEMRMTARPMTGIVELTPAGAADDDQRRVPRDPAVANALSPAAEGARLSRRRTAARRVAATPPAGPVAGPAGTILTPGNTAFTTPDCEAPETARGPARTTAIASRRAPAPGHPRAATGPAAARAAATAGFDRPNRPTAAPAALIARPRHGRALLREGAPC